jgi:cytochrome c biogenesis factor
MHSRDRHWRAFALVFGGMLAFCLALLFARFALSDYSLQIVAQRAGVQLTTQWE